MTSPPAPPRARLAIAGSGGRMGQTLIEALLASPDLCLAGAIDVTASAYIGLDAGERFGRDTGVAITDDATRTINAVDVLVDFTRPEGTLAHLAVCSAAGVGAVVGTTGLSDADVAVLTEHGRRIPIVFAANMSIGVTVLGKLAAMAARYLGDDYDVEIVEMHHRHKIDAPSGTALQLGKTVAHALGRDLKADGIFAREGVTGERPAHAIGFATLRGGDVVGDHTIIFAGAGERLELTHKASSRMNFAQGALRAARYVANLRRDGKTGVYDMTDVLGIR